MYVSKHKELIYSHSFSINPGPGRGGFRAYPRNAGHKAGKYYGLDASPSQETMIPLIHIFVHTLIQ